MRIIDADTLKAHFFRPYSNEESYSNIDIEKIIDEQITIKPERKTGKWHGNRCSECKKIFTDNIIRGGFYDIIHKPNYCPHCGVEMEV